MQLLMSLADDSKQLNQAPFPLRLDYHGPRGIYKIIHQGLMIPGLPSPLHYFNFLTIIGQPNVPMLRNDYAIKTRALDTVSLITSISPHMVGHFHGYSIINDCEIKENKFVFGQREQLEGSIPNFKLIRKDNELSVDLNIQTQPIISHFTKLKLGLFDHWSLVCQCKGTVTYKEQTYKIDQLGSFEFARAINIPYLPLHFFTYQIINLIDQRQLLLAHIRNGLNQIVQSRMYLRDLKTQTSEMFDDVYFKVHRVYPKVKTPNGHEMYLARVFEWSFENKKRKIIVKGESRGDFKFGVAAGYVGSFSYEVQIDGIQEEGQSGYCEYIDCRSLKWQEINKDEKLMDNFASIVPCTLKK
ncbi:DUF6670 family protein [Acinetobacter sp. DSM 11652]|uniref:DUF6670 family protein n=1 Tax=Acinetobacter sp. DSM 11652 TaxID=346222 RepID=UPI0008B81ABF|nr:DUF6670 family protein [Acinetobacter sp. DSM 11652]SEM13176.1 hypothetical protein SAMN05216500_1121 [Acinetobacter sp. DSM 11652]